MGPRPSAGSGGRSAAVNIWLRVKGFVDSRPGQWTIAVAAILLLELAVFRGHFSGEYIPPWDFLSHYNTEAFVWWHDGSFFRPVEWIPYLWGGYPGTLDLQNSSWYLPVGLTSLITPFTLWASSALYALHVAFGALGAFVLARRWKLAFVAQLFALVSWFFVEAFYLHASHLDVMRGFAWIPWVLLVLSPQYPWKKWWAVVMAPLVLWQAILAAYPGQLLVGVYVLAVWLGCVQLFLRPRLRDYLGPVLGAIAIAALLSMLRFLPYALTRGSADVPQGESLEWSWWCLGTFFYAGRPPGYEVTMYSFFLPVVVFVLLGLIQWRKPLVRIASITALVAWALGLAVEPWSSWVAHLPGLGISRFRADDAKLLLLISLTLLGASGLDALVKRRWVSRLTWSRALRWTYWGLLVTAAAVLGVYGPFSDRSWIVPWSILLVAVLLALSSQRLQHRARSVLVGGLLLLTLVSGAFHSWDTSDSWKQPREVLEEGFGAPISTLIASREEPSDLVQRDARLDPGPNLSASDFPDSRWSAVMYTGDYSVVGYVNLTGARTWETISASLLAASTAESARVFWSAPGIGVAVDEQGALPTPQETLECVGSGESGDGVSVTPLDYVPGDRLVYRVETSRETHIAFNEAYYRGWSARVSSSSAESHSLAVRRGVGGEVLVTVPPGRWRLTLSYSLPGLTWAWVLFSAGCLAVFGWAVALLCRHRRGAILQRRDR